MIKFDQEGYRNSIAHVNEDILPPLDYLEIFQLPSELLTPNGIAVSDGMIWLADTSSSAVFNLGIQYDAPWRFQQTGTFPLPATATPVESTIQYIYLFGFATTASP